MSAEELYKQETEHRERIRTALGVPVGLLVVIGGGLGAMLQSAWIEVGVLCIFFWLLASASCGFFLKAMYFLVRSYHGHVYRQMPFPAEQLRYRDGLREWHNKYGGGQVEADREYAAYLEDRYTDAADHNAYVNVAKSEYLFRANASMVNCVVLTVLAFVPFATHRISNPAAVQKIEILKWPTDTQGAKSMSNENQPVQKPATAPPPPPKPPAPPLRDLKEGQIPRPPEKK